MPNRPYKSPLAEIDLFAIWGLHRRRQRQVGGCALVERIEATFDMLADTPLAGRARGDLVKNLRSFPVGNYIIFYFPRADGIQVARVIHGRQDIDADDLE